VEGPTGPTGPASAVAYGELYITENTVATTLTPINTYVPITAGWVNGLSSGMTPQAGSSNVLCDTAGTFLAVCSTTHTNSSGSNKEFHFVLAVNGVAQEKSSMDHTSTGNGGRDTVALSALLALTVGQTVDLRIKCTNDNNTPIVVRDVNLSLSRVGD